MKTTILLAVALLVAAGPTCAQEIMPGATPTPSPTPTPADEKVPIPAATASTHDGNLPANTLDGSLATRWSGYGDGAWAAYDLGSERALTRVRVAAYNGNMRKSRFDLQVSANGLDWSTARSAQSSGTTTALETYDLTATTRHVRYLGHGFVTNAGSTGLWNSVTELEVWARPIPPTPPAAPTGVRAVAEVAQVRLTWSTTGGAAYYQVWRRTDSCTYTPIRTVTPPSGDVQTYTDTDVVVEQRYYYVITAHSSAGGSPPSSPVAATPRQATTGTQTIPTPTPTMAPITDVPLPPTALTASGSDNSVRVGWTPGSSGGYGDSRRWDRFLVFRSDLACGPFLQIAVSSAWTRDYVDDSVTNGQTYHYVVSAANGLGESLDSPVATVTPEARVPAAPTNLKGYYDIHAEPTIHLEWDSGFDADRYVVRRATTPGGPYATIASNVPKTTTTTRYADKDLVIGTTYYYVVAGVNAVGVGAVSNELSRTALAPPPPPSNLTATPGDQRVTLQWDPVPGSSYYICSVSPTPGGPYNGGLGSAATSIVMGGLTNGTRYYFVCFTETSYGRSGPSAEVSAVPVGGPPTPTNLTGRVVTDAAGAGVGLWWSPSTGATSYNIYRGTFSTDMALLAPSSTTSYVDRAITPGTTYSYEVTAVSSAGESARSMRITVPVPVAHREIPLTPSQVTASTSDANVPANTVDGSLATRWSGNGIGAWIRYDLGQVRQVGRVTIGVYNGNARRNRFRLIVSDGSTAIEYPRESTGTTTIEQAYDFPVGPVRYVTYLGEGSTNVGTGATSTWNSLTEVSVYEAYVPTPSPTPTPTCAPFPMPPTPPPAPTNVTATPGDGVLTLTWTGAPPDPTWSWGYFEVWRAPASNGSYQLVHTTSSQTYTDGSGVPAYYKVRQFIPYTSGFYPPCPNSPARADGAFSAPVYGAPVGTTPTPTPIPGSEDGCVKWQPPPVVVTASTHDGNVPANAVDGDLSTRWSGYGDGAWLKFDLGAVRTVCFVKIGFYRGSERVYRFDLQPSSDGVTWTTLMLDARSGGTSPALEKFDIVPDTPMRWLRYVGHGNSVNLWSSITELEIWVVP